MAVQSRWTTCPAYIKAKATKEGSDEWAYFSNLSYTLSMALVGVRFPQAKRDMMMHNEPEPAWGITEDNWKECFVRISVWEHLFGSFRMGWDNDLPQDGPPEPTPVDLPFAPEEIVSMIGLSVNAGTQTDEEFGQHMYQNMKRKAQDKLRKYLREHNDGDDSL